MKRWISLLCGLLCVAPASQASESVLYWVTDQSIAHRVTNRLVRASATEDKTDIFAIDPETGKKRLVFSDANAEFMLLPGGRWWQTCSPRAFQIAASNPFAGGATCKAGLLNALPENQFACDIHPSQSGQKLIARVVGATFASAIRKTGE